MKFLLLILISLFLLFSCNNESNTNKNSTQEISVNAQNLAKTINYHPGDPFIKTLKESEFFKISGLENNILETKEGTILSIPKGAFRDKNGNLVEKEIHIEIIDIKSIEDQILSNVTSQQGGKMLQSGGSFFINATQNGDQLALNEENPIYIETNIKDPESDYLIFEGIRNEKGEMQWINPVQPRKHLIPVNIDELDFLPEGFQTAVNKGMPFRNHKTADKNLTDSLYYSLTSELSNLSSEKLNGLIDSNGVFLEYDRETQVATTECKGIDPASIKVLKTNKFSKTFISTRDFEKRLKVIHNLKRPELLDIYVENLTLNMSTCDSMVLKMLPKNSSSALKFADFARENLGNVKNLPKSIEKLGEYYSKELENTRAQLKKARDDYQSILDKKDDKAREIENEYKRVLTKRLVYRLEKFGYEVRYLGWSNIAKVLEPLEKFNLEIVVEGGSSFDYLNVYTVDKNIQSIFALISSDKILFNRGYNHDLFLLYKKLQTATSVVVAYKDGIPYYAEQDFKVTPEINIVLSPIQTDNNELKGKLRKLNKGHTSFNKIQDDLQFQAIFYEERKRKKTLMKEREFINSLVKVAFDCENNNQIEVEFEI